MKRLMAFFLATAMICCLLPATAFAANTTPADLGWSTAGNNFTGWTVDNGVIRCDFASASNARMWRAIGDLNNFKLSADITCDRTTSPYIQLCGVIVELDANGGNGNQVFPKLNGSGSEWINATGNQVHVEINRYQGGQLHITITGKDNPNAKVLTVPCGGGNENVEIGMYRGGFITLANYAITAPDETDEPAQDDNKPGAGAEVSDRDSEVWDLGTNWGVDEKDELLILTSTNSNTTMWNQTLDLTQSLSFSFDWILNTTINSNDTWAEKISVQLHDPNSDDYLFLRLQRYRNGGGLYQVYISAQWWDGATSSWSADALDVWTAKMSGGVLDSVHVKIERDAEQETLQIKLYDNDDDTSLGSAVLKPSSFSDPAVSQKMSNIILKGTALPVGIGAESTSAPYYITNPVLGALEKEIKQNLFACEDVWKPVMDTNGNLSFTTKNLGFGWMEYNAGLDVAAGLDFSYTITANEFKDGIITNAIRLRYSESPEEYIFARIQFREDGSYALKAQLWNGNWTDVLGGNNWISANVTDQTWTVRVTVADGTLTFSMYNSKGELLGKQSASNLSGAFTSCENLELMFCAEGNGLHTMSNFKGLPEIYSADLRSDPFGKVIFAGDLVSGWTENLLTDIAEYQNKTPLVVNTAWSAGAIAAENGNLIILSHGKTALQSGKSAEEFAAELAALVAEVKQNAVSGTVIVITGLPYMQNVDCSAYNAAIRAVAQEQNVLYANLYRAMSQASWTVDENNELTANGNQLVAGEILQELLRRCTCLAVNATTEIKVSASAPVERTEGALAAFRNANDAESLKKALEDAHLGADLDLYLGFTSAVQQKVVEALLAVDRSALIDFQVADTLITALCMEIGANNARPIVTGAPFKTYVAVGDSISYGETAVNKKTDGWVPRLAAMISAAQGEDVTLINKAISGTRMCTITDNGMFPAAKDTVQEYIVANNPDFITISYGINDLHARTSLEEFITTYRTYLQEVVAGCPDAVIMICGLSAKGGDADSATLKKWNDSIKGLAEEFGLIYHDSYQDTRGVEWLLSDGLHPTNAGYRVMANSAFRTLSAYVDLTGETQPGQNPGDQPSDPSDPSDPTTPNDPTNPTDPTEPTDPSDPDGSETPNGSNGWIIAVIAVVVVAAAAAAVVIYKKKNP